MARKRGNGEGSISQRPNGLWQGQISLGRDEETGKTKRATFYGKTRREVANKISDALADQQKGEFIEKSTVKFNHYLKLWLKNKETSLSGNTISKYKSLSENHIEKPLGNIELQKLTRQDIQDLINGSKLSPKSLAEIHMIVKNVIELALEDGTVRKNVCRKIQMPVIKEKQIKILTPAQISGILKQCHKTRIYDIVLLELTTGLRRGEILGLTWDDIDFKNKTININKSWIVVDGTPQWSDTETGTKTKSSNRVVAIPDETIAELQHRQSLHKNDTYVFQDKNGNPYNPNNFLRDFKKYAKKAGIEDFSFHDLRHNYGTQLAAVNTHTRLIEAQLGHKDYRSSRRYIHATEKGQHDAARKIGKVLKNIKKA